MKFLQKRKIEKLQEAPSVSLTPSAKVVDGTLIISLPDALTPVVWRMELGSVKASALEVRNGTEGGFMLTLKTPKGEEHDIAPFSKRDSAVFALMCVSEALQQGQGLTQSMAPIMQNSQQTLSLVPSATTTTKSSLWQWVMALTGVIAVIFVFALIGRMEGETITTSSIPGAETATSITGQPNSSSGMPQSADDFLMGNQ